MTRPGSMAMRIGSTGAGRSTRALLRLRPTVGPALAMTTPNHGSRTAPTMSRPFHSTATGRKAASTTHTMRTLCVMT